MARVVNQAEIDPRFAETEFVIAATHNEMHALWRQYSTEAIETFGAIPFGNDPRQPSVKWLQDCRGLFVEVGRLADMPVCISVAWATLNGHRVMFYEPTSQVVDHRMIDSWLKEMCNPQWDGGTRRAHADAANFHLCLEHVE